MDFQNNNKITAAQNEQQAKLEKEIINDIIQILADNNLTISASQSILHKTSKAICNQIVKTSQ